MIAPARRTRHPRVCWAYGLTGIVSSGLIPLATGHHVLYPERIPEDDHHDGHEARDDDGQRRSLRELGASEEVHHQVRDQAALGSTDQGRSQELTQDRDEHEDAGGDDPGPDL